GAFVGLGNDGGGPAFASVQKRTVRHRASGPDLPNSLNRSRFEKAGHRGILLRMTAMDRPISRPPAWRQRRVLIAGGAAAGILVLLIAAVLAVGSVSSVRVPAATVTIDTAEPGVFHDFVPLKGKAAPKDEIYLDVLDGGQV